MAFKPTGARPEPIRASKPWRDAEGNPTDYRMVRTSEGEIDVCLNCTKISCRYGYCQEVNGYRHQSNTKPVPKGFAEYVKTHPNESDRELCKVYDVPLKIIRRWKRECNFDFRVSNREDKETIKQAIRAGTSTSEIKRIFHCGHSTVVNIRKEMEMEEAENRE